ncbi:MAG TPA: TolC family protein, partial [Verrucomicrobiae bacterium]|nr:TolC family protein [Verrucomicrobiae bacterium]
NTPDNFRGAAGDAASTNSFADLPWWGVFKDPALQDLVRAALTNNCDVRITLTKVDQNRAFVRQIEIHPVRNTQ